jgi:hypothetical protein
MQSIKKKRENNIKKGRQKGPCVWSRRRVLSLTVIMSASVVPKCSSATMATMVPSESSIKVIMIFMGQGQLKFS